MSMQEKLHGDKPTVVVLDDRRTDLTFSRVMLENKGFHVVTMLAGAADSEAGTKPSEQGFLDRAELLMKIRKANPVLVLSDFQMPNVKLSGLDVRAAVGEAMPGLPVVIQSSEHEKIPGFSDVIAENNGVQLKSAYAKNNPKRFNDIASFAGERASALQI